MLMDNQQERSRISLEFLAGVICGEGHFGISFNAKYGRPDAARIITPKFSLQMNDIECMDAVIALLAEFDISHYVSKVPWKSTRTDIPPQDSKRIDIQGFKRLQKFIPLIMPYMIGSKRRAAEIVFEYVTVRLGKPPRAPYEDREIELVNTLRRVNASSGSYGKRFLKSSEAIRRVSVVHYADKDMVQP